MAASVDSSGKANLSDMNVLTIPQKTTGMAQETSLVQLGLNFPADAKVLTKEFNRNDPADVDAYIGTIEQWLKSLPRSFLSSFSLSSKSWRKKLAADGSGKFSEAKPPSCNSVHRSLPWGVS